jgi:hypothetical protein
VDWRFLLPTPVPERSICFENGVLAEALRIVSVSAVDPESAAATDCDLAVAVNPGQQRILEAWGRLRPGGSVYFEFSPTRLFRKATTFQYLDRLGFKNVACYRPWPSAEAAQYWVPLNSPAARRYLFAIRMAEASLCRRVRELGAHLRWVANLHFRRSVPLCVIARKPPSIPGDRVEQMLQRALPRVGSDRSRHGRSQMLMTGGRRSINKVVSMIFAGRCSEPILAAKMPRVSGSALALTKEASLLESVRSLNGDLNGIPELLFKGEIGGTFTIGLTGFIGIPIFARLQRSTYRSFAIKATDWLIALAGEPRCCPRHLWWRRLVEPIFIEFDRCYGRVVCSQERQRAEHIICGLPALPMVFEQRDFSPWNVLVTRSGNLAVLDWESASPTGLPGVDLIYFLTYLGFFLDGATEQASYQRSYRLGKDPKTFTGSVNLECLQRYMNALGLSTRYLHALRLFTWMLHSRSEYEHLLSDTGHEPTSEALDHALFLSLWRQELHLGADARATTEFV